MNGICHFEIPAHDLNRVSKFYADVFGWNSFPMDDNYAFFKTPDGPGGGFSTCQKPVEDPGYNFYIEVEDIPGAFEKIKNSGGEQVKEKTEISPDHGFFGVFKDSEGNIIGLWSKQ